MSNTLEQAHTSALITPPVTDNAIMDVVNAFVAEAQQIQHVQRVLIEEGQLPIRIWTVISAPPFDSAYTTPVYEAELAVLQNPTFPLTGFRLVNLQEIDGDDMLPMSLKTVFERP